MNKLLKIIGLAGVMVGCSQLPLLAQDLQQLSLEKAWQIALANKPALRNYALEDQIAAARVAETRQQKAFKLNATADAQVNPFLPASIIPVGQFNLQNPTDDTRAIKFGTWWQAAVGLSASKSLLDPSLNAQIREQEFQTRINALNQEQNKSQIKLQLAQAYYALLLANAEISFLEVDLARAETLLQDAKQLHTGGKGLIADVNTAQMQVNAAQIQLDRANANRALARENLLYRMGLNSKQGETLVLTDQLTTILEKVQADFNANFDLSTLDQNKPELMQLSLDNQLQNLKTATEKARLKPSLSATAYLGLNNLTDKTPLFAENSWFSNGNIALHLTVPVSGYWELKKHTEAYTLKQQQNANQLEDLHQQLDYNFKSALSAYQIAQKELLLRQNDVDLATQNLALARDQYREGGALISGASLALAVLQQKQYAWMQTAYNLLLADLDMKNVRGELK